MKNFIEVTFITFFELIVNSDDLFSSFSESHTHVNIQHDFIVPTVECTILYIFDFVI